MQLEQFCREICVRNPLHDEEMLCARKRRRRGKLPPGEQSVGPRGDKSKSWNECGPSEPGQQDTGVNGRMTITKVLLKVESNPEMLETKQRLFWDSEENIARLYDGNPQSHG